MLGEWWSRDNQKTSCHTAPLRLQLALVEAGDAVLIELSVGAWRMNRMKRTRIGWRSARLRVATVVIWLLAAAIVVLIGRFLWTAMGAAG